MSVGADTRIRREQESTLRYEAHAGAVPPPAHTLRSARALRVTGTLLVVVALATAILNRPAMAAPAPDSAAALQAQYKSFDRQLAETPFPQPLSLASKELPSTLEGEIFARVQYPFAKVSAALNDPAHWCDVMILHINTKLCQASGAVNRSQLTVHVGKKTPEPLEDTHRIQFTWQALAATPRFLSIRMDAADGPMGTHDYRIQLQAIPAGANQTFLRLTYAYGYGMSGRLAMKSYLATLGRDKVGFTRLASASGEPGYIGGMRGVAERNTMRYFLAIEAYLASLAAPEAQQLQQRLTHWFNATERYARQLHEVERTAYLSMKRSEYARQQSVQ